jgi:hypothetical protein
VFDDDFEAKSYSEAAKKVWKDIQDEIPGRPRMGLYDQITGLYRWAKHQDGVLAKSNFATWYTDTVALIWPHSAPAREVNGIGRHP